MAGTLKLLLVTFSLLSRSGFLLLLHLSFHSRSLLLDQGHPGTSRSPGSRCLIYIEIWTAILLGPHGSLLSSVLLSHYICRSVKFKYFYIWMFQGFFFLRLVPCGSWRCLGLLSHPPDSYPSHISYIICLYQTFCQ